MSEIYGNPRNKVKCITTKDVVGVKCDICGRIIKAKERPYGDDDCKYYDVMTGHRDWGNDSCDSIEHHDVCPECLIKVVSKYFTNNEHDSAYMDIEPEYAGFRTIELNNGYMDEED